MNPLGDFIRGDLFFLKKFLGYGKGRGGANAQFVGSGEIKKKTETWKEKDSGAH